VHHLLLAPLVEVFQRLRHRHPPWPRHRLHGGPGECDGTLPGRGTGEREAVSETAYGTVWEEHAPCHQESARPPPGISSQATAAHLPASCRRPPPCRLRCLLAHRHGPPPCRSPPPASPPPCRPPPPASLPPCRPPASPPPCRPPPPASLPPCRPPPRASLSTGKHAGASRKSEEAGGAGWRNARPVGIW
jgi:hypothetical protein